MQWTGMLIIWAHERRCGVDTRVMEVEKDRVMAVVQAVLEAHAIRLVRA